MHTCMIRHGSESNSARSTKKPLMGLHFYADRTGLEPATSCVTGRHSNQLNYRSVIQLSKLLPGRCDLPDESGQAF